MNDKHESASTKYNILSQNNELNSTNGICTDSLNFEFFYKITTNMKASRQIHGYKILSSYVSCSKLIQAISLNDFQSMLVFKKNNALLENNKGLLCDLLNEGKVNYPQLKAVLNSYLSTFKIQGYSSDNYQFNSLFRDRLPAFNHVVRLPIINSKTKKNLVTVSRYIRQFAPNQSKYLTHGDPGDTNFCSDGSFIDFEESGFNDAAVEFVIFFWNLYLGGSYIFPKYQPSKYALHKLVYKNKVKMINSRYHFSISVKPQRRLFIIDVIDRFSKIISAQDKPTNDEEILNLFIFRITTVIPLCAMSLSDQYIIYSIINILPVEVHKMGIFEALRKMVYETFEVS